jgi:ankyrin repeat protein
VTTLDNLKKEAKRWLKALHAGDAAARERLAQAWPDAPADPGLRDVQHALAREHGHQNWRAFGALVGTAAEPMPSRDALGDRIVSSFLQMACWDHREHGKADHRMYDRAAQRLLAQHPDLAQHSLYTAIVCGNIAEVRRILDARPAAAREPGGSRGWTPILYLSYTRFTAAATVEHAIEIARLLLDRGASPNDFYMAGDSEYSCLVGAAGEGEQDSPRQPYAESLYGLLLDRGAGPYDIQVLYNTHFSGDMLWWLELTYRRSLAIGRKADWDDPHWLMLDMGGYGSGAHFVLNTALRKNDLVLAEWALAHGASPNSDVASNPKFKLEHTVYDMAVMRGLTGFADLLRRYGGKAGTAPLSPDESFLAACMRLDRPAAERIVAEHPELLRSHQAMFEAAKRDRPDVMALLLDLGVPLEIEDRNKARALHHAAAANALGAARFLIERGADGDPRETAYNATPIGWAAHGDHVEMIDFLSQHTRNIWTLCFRGYVDRVRELLSERPELARQSDNDGITPLWWLPDDESKAMEIVDLLLAAGADPAARSREGGTAADWARTRGMTEIARKLAVDGVAPPAAIERGEQPAELARFERLAEDLLFAFESGNPESMRRLMRHFGGEISWGQLRTAVRQRLEQMGEARPEGYFALPHARLLIARQSGFDNWAALEEALSSRDVADVMFPPVEPIAPPAAGPADVPVEMRTPFTMRLRDNAGVETTDVWRILMACRDGDLAAVKDLLDAWPALIRSGYNYMTPLHLAVREGHLDIVRSLAERGGVNRNYVTYPYKETLVTVANDRGYGEIAALLEEHGARADPDRPGDESGHIEYKMDFERRRFQRLVGANAVSLVEEMLQRRPELAADPFAFWSEGVLMTPAGNHHRAMIEVLMKYGARVPALSKWGAEYYFKHEDLAAFFLERGMDPNHMNCHHTTLLHEMARRGEIGKATLLLDHGAAIDAVDQEFRSTPLGFAARWGQQEMVALLLARGADPRRAGAPWATPLAWAKAKGHGEIARVLEGAGG